MAEKFIGMTIGVTLHQPPGAVLIGRVTNVILGQTLALEQVHFPASGRTAAVWSVSAANIAELQVVDANTAHTPVTPSRPAPNVQPPRAHPVQPATDSPSVPRQAFVDPAILSFGKSPAPASRVAPPPPTQSKPAPAPVTAPAPAPTPPPVRVPEPAPPAPPAQAAPTQGAVELSAVSSPAPATPVKSMLAAAAARLPAAAPTSPFVAHAPESIKRPASEKPAKKLPQDFFADNTPVAAGAADVEGAQQVDSNGGKRAKRGRKVLRTPAPVVTAATEAQIVKEALSPNVSRSGKDMNATPANNKKGWRSTPLLKEAVTPAAVSAKGKKKSKRMTRASELQNDQNGWATEEATDIQDLGDFDFEANHAKFDKRTVFDQIRNEDTTADEDRLVSHNRLARPGTYGGKNLHPTENVLSPTLKPQYESQELASTSDADTELNFGSGQNSKRAMSRTSATKQPPRRSNSNVPEDGQHPLTASFTSTAFNRSMSSLRNANTHITSSAVSTSPNPNRTRSPASIRSPLQSMENLDLARSQGPHFHTRHTNQTCQVLSPERLRQAEAEAVASVKISADALTENAARGIAEGILSRALRAVPSRRSSKPNAAAANGSGSPRPVVAILAGNHLAGARAVASARHIFGRGFKVLISVIDFSNPSLWHPQLAKQIQSLQALGRKAARIEGWRSTSGYIKRLDGPPAVIVDALLDGQKHSEIRAVEQQLDTRDMIDWANRSRAGVVSINIPSGFCATDGSTSVVEGEPLAIRPETVLALTTPVAGLFEAVKEGEGSHWHIDVIDIGVNIALRDRERINFGASWTISLDFSRGEQA